MRLNINNLKQLHSESQQAYYSTTQTHLFKAYAHHVQFINRLNELFNNIQKRKIFKAIDEVKATNKTFKRYLNERRITHLKIQDIIAFQELCQKSNTLIMEELPTSKSSSQQNKRRRLPHLSFIKGGIQSRISNINLSSKMSCSQQKVNSLSVQSKQMIKKGLMSLLQKLQTLKKDQFLNQTKYLQSVLIRQCRKLQQYGFDDEAFGVLKKKERNYNAKLSAVDQIQKEEKNTGLYPIIMKNVREETLAIQRIQKTYQNLMTT